MGDQLLVILGLHLVLCVFALARIFDERAEPIPKVFTVLWTAMSIAFPVVGPLMALAFVHIPGPDSDL